MNEYIFTSESVSEGHPDKVADLISDSVLDYYLRYDQNAKVACETLFADRMIVVAGEVNSTFQPSRYDIEEVVRKALKEIGYTDEHNALIAINVILNSQSPEINAGVVHADGEIGAGDQGIMFGYSTNETKDYMPAPIYYSHLIMRKLAEYRKNFKGAGLLPDAKCQVTMKYVNDKPTEITDIVISHQHNKMLTLFNLQQFLENQVFDIFKNNNEDLTLLKNTKYHINPAGTFHIGGAEGDAGLTGRKIIVDTYGGACPHGGGAFSGKDSTKVDRSAAYMARYAAKNLNAAGVGDKVLIQVSYAIGEIEPVSMYVKVDDKPRPELEKIIKEVFDFTPKGIIETLGLNKPIFTGTTNYGHFGKPDLPWEKLDKVEEIKKLIKEK